MKSITTISKILSTITDDDLTAIVSCADVDVPSLSEKEKMSVLVFNELAKALNNKSHTLVLDCNYPQSKMHLSEKFLVDYYRLVSTDTKNQSMVQFYVSANPGKQTCTFRLCTSVALKNREQFDAMHDDLKFDIKRNPKTGAFKTSERRGVDYAELVDVVKAVLDVLAAKPEPKTEEPETEEEE